MGKRQREFWQSACMNNMTFIHYYNRLVELSVSMFKWKNLPPTIDPRFVELVLFTDGKIVFFKDEDLGGLVACRVVATPPYDNYNNPKVRRAYASNGFNKMLDETNSVIIYNNYLRTNSMLDVEMFARRLYDLDRTIDVNVKAQKTPILLECDEAQRLTLKNFYMKYDGNEPFIFGTKDSISNNGIKVFQTGAPFIADKTYLLKTNIWNDALTSLGISNVNTHKKERLITKEVNQQQGGTIASRNSRLNARNFGCESIKLMFGESIVCEYDDDVELMATEPFKDGGSNE